MLSNRKHVRTLKGFACEESTGSETNLELDLVEPSIEEVNGESTRLTVLPGLSAHQSTFASRLDLATTKKTAQ